MLSEAPASNEAQLRYFANVLLNFLPPIFHGSEWKNRFDAYMDFSEFYLTEFDAACSSYFNKNQEFQKDYPFRFSHLHADELEKELQNCLMQLVSLFPEEGNSSKASIMWHICRLFELFHSMDNLFIEEPQER